MESRNWQGRRPEGTRLQPRQSGGCSCRHIHLLDDLTLLSHADFKEQRVGVAASPFLLAAVFTPQHVTFMCILMNVSPGIIVKVPTAELVLDGSGGVKDQARP